MKKYPFLSLLLAALLSLSLVCPALALDDPQPNCRAAILVDGDNNEVLYDFNARQRMYPALHEMGVRHAQRLGLGVHPGHKLRRGARHRLRQDIGGR